MSKSKYEIVRACVLCGKLQKKSKEKSNKNWSVYDANASCECGGKFAFMSREEADSLRR